MKLFTKKVLAKCRGCICIILLLHKVHRLWRMSCGRYYRQKCWSAKMLCFFLIGNQKKFSLVITARKITGLDFYFQWFEPNKKNVAWSIPSVCQKAVTFRPFIYWHSANAISFYWLDGWSGAYNVRPRAWRNPIKVKSNENSSAWCSFFAMSPVNLLKHKCCISFYSKLTKKNYQFYNSFDK